jgi:hypothetical protein
VSVIIFGVYMRTCENISVPLNITYLHWWFIIYRDNTCAQMWKVYVHRRCYERTVFELTD